MGEVEERPWERPGCVRRDCDPHRGPLLMLLAAAGTLGSSAALVFAPAALVSLPLCIAVWRTAKRDLNRMSEGAMDPQGSGKTEAAQECAAVGAVLSVLGLSVAAVWFLVWLSVQ
jgi:hypothetical protein